MTIKLVYVLFILLAHQPMVLCMKRERGRIAPQERSEKPRLKQSKSTSYGRQIAKMHEAKQRKPSLHGAAYLIGSEIQKMLDAGADLQEIYKGETPLHRFISASHQDGIKKLLLHGALLTAVDEDGDTAVHRAAYNNHHIARIVLISPQGSPVRMTQEFKRARETTIVFMQALKNRSFPREIRRIIRNYMLPDPKKLLEMLPLHELLYYLKYYSVAQKKVMLDFLVKRHISDVFFAYNAENYRGQTPFALAKDRSHRMRPFTAPVRLLNSIHFNELKPLITANYAQLLGLQVA
ncbi:MAG: ankyrin repeat domain-containing protein [Candidatus Babeliales bacterium]